MLKPLLKYTTQQSQSAYISTLAAVLQVISCGIDAYPCYDVLLSAMKRYRGGLPERRLMAAFLRRARRQRRAAESSSSECVVW